MFKIANFTKQIFNVVRNVPKSTYCGINSMFKYSSQSKGYVEDAADEFTFLKALPSQSINVSIQDKFKDFNLNLQNIEEVKPTQLLDPADIRKLIYARFADEIAAKPSDAAENQNLETKSHAAREHAEACSTYSITEEFKIFKEQGYNFAATRQVLQNRNQDTNQSPKSMYERMKELSISGYLSNYSGYPHLREDIELIMSKKSVVIKEFMQKVNEKVGFVSVDNSVLLVNTTNEESLTDVTKTDLLGEY